MAKYRVLIPSFINNGLRAEGEVVEYDGVPGPNLEAIDAEGEAAKAGAVNANAESLGRRVVAAAGGDPNDPNAAVIANLAVKAAQGGMASFGPQVVSFAEATKLAGSADNSLV